MNDLNVLIALGIAIAVIVLVSLPASIRLKKSGKKVSGGAAGAFAVLDELFHPTAKEHRQVMEEQSEARVPMPSADDKPFPENKITIIRNRVESGQ